MLSKDVSISVENLGKKFNIYRSPLDRLKHLLFPKAKRFHQEFWALRNVSFSIRKGQTVGIIGTNGSGKSTLLQLLYGTLSKTEGSVETSGPIVALLELGAGFNLEFSGRENILLNANILGYPRYKIEEKMAQIIEFSELERFIDQPVKTYSSGMYARLAFSVAIHVEPEILFIDETLSVGDARFISKCMRKIMEMKAQGITILFVSHDVGSVRSLCEEVIWIDKGRLVAKGDIFEVTANYIKTLLSPNAKESSANAEPEATHLPSAPIVHWGSHLGLIQKTSLTDESGEQKPEIDFGDQIVIKIHAKIPKSVPRAGMFFSVSIKDLNGIDVIVKSVSYADVEQSNPDSDEEIHVQFALRNILNSGKYLLAASVENRTDLTIDYYEYAEGLQYFSSVVRGTDPIFGIVHPEVAVEARSMT